MEWTLGEIAEITGATLEGDPTTTINRVSPLELATEGAVSFLANKRHYTYLKNTAASAVILSPEYQAKSPVATLVCADPYLAFAKTLRFMHSSNEVEPGIHSSAIVGENCEIDSSAYISANVVIGDDCVISADTFVGANCVISSNVKVGANTRLMANVTLCEGVTLGDFIIIHPGCVIGADGFGIVQENSTWLKIPQIGAVVIENNVEIGANTTIDRGALTDTYIEEGVKIDNQVQIAHGVRIGAHTAIAGCVAIAGSAIIGKHCMIGGMCAISGHIHIADGVTITGMSGVSNSIKQSGVYSAGIPVAENSMWRKNIARFRNLDNLARRLIKLETKLDKN